MKLGHKSALYRLFFPSESVNKHGVLVKLSNTSAKFSVTDMHTFFEIQTNVKLPVT